MVILKSFWSYIHTIPEQYVIFEILVDSTKSAGYPRGRPLKQLHPALSRLLQSFCLTRKSKNENVSTFRNVAHMPPRYGRIYFFHQTHFFGVFGVIFQLISNSGFGGILKIIDYLRVSTLVHTGS